MSLRSFRLGVVFGGMVTVVSVIVLSGSACPAKTISGNVSKTDQDPTVLLYFRGVIDSDISTRESFLDDTVDGHITEPIKEGNEIIAPAGSKLVGHIETLAAARHLISAPVGRNARHRHGSLTIRLDKIVRPDKKEILISGLPVKQQSIFGNEGRFKEIDVDDDGAIQKATSLDMWGSPDFAMVMPESILKFGRRLDVHIEEGDELDFKAEVVPEELSALARLRALVQQAPASADNAQKQAADNAVPH